MDETKEEGALTPGAIRKLMEQAAEKAVKKFAGSLGYDDVDELREALSGSSTREDRGESQQARASRERKERDYAARQEADAKMKADAEAIKTSHSAEIARIQAESDLKIAMLGSGIKKADLPLAMYEYSQRVSSMDDAGRKAYTHDQFVADLGASRPYFFDDGKAPVVESKTKTTTVGTMPAAVKAGAGVAPKDYSKATPAEAEARIREIIRGS